MEEKNSTRIKELVLLAALVISIGAAEAYLYTNRPLVDYTLENKRVIQPQGEDREFEVTVKTKNRGGFDAPSKVKIFFENVELKESSLQVTLEEPNTATLNMTLKRGKEKYSERTFTFSLKPDAERFGIGVRVNVDFDYSLSGTLYYIFGEIRGYRPISVEYSRSENGEYRLIE